MQNDFPGKIRSHRDLTIWQKGLRLAGDVFRITDGFPRREIYGLTSQMRRAAASIPANIAEGHARRSTRDYLRFLSITNGSLRELDTLGELAFNLTYLRRSDWEKLQNDIAEIGRMLFRLRQSLGRRLAPLTSES